MTEDTISSGSSQRITRCFADITWSTNRVFSQTIERAEEEGLDVEVLPSWYDVEDGPSLDRLREELFGTADGACPVTRGYHAPHTRRFLAQLLRRAARGLRSGIHVGDGRSW
jgi:hypothetical protein